MRTYRADLHIHTCLSPCAELEMTPLAIVQVATELGLDMIGICDHNAAANVPATVRAAGSKPLTVISGMEVTTREEVHVLALFAAPEAALDLEAYVQGRLSGENDPELFGEQVVVDEHNEPLELCPKLLIGATSLSVEQVVEAIHARGGCAIAAHVDRERFGIVGQLGFIPPRLPLDGLEHSRKTARSEACERFSDGGRWEMLCSSDAHRLGEIGMGSTFIRLESPTLDELRMALRREGGRTVVD